MKQKSSEPFPNDLQDLITKVRSLIASIDQGKADLKSEIHLLKKVAQVLEQAAQTQQEVERLQKEEKTLLDALRYAREELERKIEEISLVRLVAETGIRCLLSENPLQFILDHVTQITEAEHGSIMLLEEDRGKLFLAASHGPNRIPPYERSYTLGEGIARWVDQSLSGKTSSLDPTQIELLRESDPEYGSFLCYPLIVDRTLVGVLSIGHSRQETFTDNTERILYIIANQVALAVYNSHLLSLHKKQKSVIEHSQDRYRSLVEQVNDLLDLARLETGNLQFEKKPVHIREVLTGLRPNYKPDLRDKKIRMLVQIPKRIPTFQGDTRKINQALCILIESAIRSTPEHGSIRLQVSLEELNSQRWPKVKVPSGTLKFLLFALSDTAPSIPQQLHGTIFERLQNQGTESRDSRGPSLSLYLAKEIIESHKGQIWLESGDSQGNTYFFTLPIL